MRASGTPSEWNTGWDTYNDRRWEESEKNVVYYFLTFKIVFKRMVPFIVCGTLGFDLSHVYVHACNSATIRCV